MRCAYLFSNNFDKGKELHKLIGYNSKDTGKLKDALLGLITIAIEWNVIDCATGQEKNGKQALSWLLLNYQVVLARMNIAR